jgi:probable HAF family extracellular repeat protein
MNRKLISMKYAPILLTGFLFLSPPALAVPYVVTDLGELVNGSVDGGTVPGFPGNSINIHGEVAGTSNDLPFLYSGGQMINIESFANTPLPPVERLGSALGINDAGHVVGIRRTGIDEEFGGSITSAFPYNGQNVIDLGTLNENEFSLAYSINNKDEVVGYSGRDAFLYSNGTMTNIDKLPGHNNAVAQDINDNGTVIGYSFLSDNVNSQYSPVRAFVYEGGTTSELALLPGDTGNNAYSINEAGLIVGTSYVDMGPTQNGSSFNAVMWDGGNVIDLGTLNGHTESIAYSVNNKGDVVGLSWDDAQNVESSFLYSDGHMYDLLSLVGLTPYIIQRAVGINDAGQIIAIGRIGTESKALLLTPVPEPGTYALMLSGLLLLLAKGKKKLPMHQWLQKLMHFLMQSHQMQPAFA